ncbi:MAG: cytochrome c family protein [Candidatus Binatia bacterium]
MRYSIVILVSLPVLLWSSSPSSSEPGQREYIGVQICEQCHRVQHLSWSKGPHARAFGALKPGRSIEMKRAAGLDPMKDYTVDGKCLRCHTTGYRRPGGFVSLESTPNMVNVQCESCHGAGSEYVEKVMRRKFSFAHAEVDDLGHISYTDRLHSHSAVKEHSHCEEHNQPNKYAYNVLGDPPPYAHRHEGKIFALDSKKASHCTETCHNKESPTYRVSDIRDFIGTFEKRVKKGVHKRYGLLFIHW